MKNIAATSVFALAVLIPSLATADIADRHRFTRDGETYVYTLKTDHARQVIDGYRQSTGARFHLVLRGDMVSGVSDGTTVSFRAPNAGRALPLETASR